MPSFYTSFTFIDNIRTVTHQEVASEHQHQMTDEVTNLMNNYSHVIYIPIRIIHEQRIDNICENYNESTNRTPIITDMRLPNGTQLDHRSTSALHFIYPNTSFQLRFSNNEIREFLSEHYAELLRSNTAFGPIVGYSYIILVDTGDGIYSFGFNHDSHRYEIQSKWNARHVQLPIYR